jgi:hypothetical protein
MKAVADNLMEEYRIDPGAGIMSKTEKPLQSKN